MLLDSSGRIGAGGKNSSGTYGIGGSTADEELSKLSDLTNDIKDQSQIDIPQSEYLNRISNLVSQMAINNIDAVVLYSGSNLYYYTATTWRPSERFVGCLLFADGSIDYIFPKFETGTFKSHLGVDGNQVTLVSWDEHEDPYDLILDRLSAKNIKSIALDPIMPYFAVSRLQAKCSEYSFSDAYTIVFNQRSKKSDNEIAIMQRANDMTLLVHRAVASILREGIGVAEVVSFINSAHKAVGAAGSSFCIVLFGEDSSFPHGVPNPRNLRSGDMVLIDTGCQLYGYNSDITRSYVFGDPTPKQIEIWNHEKQAQQVAFDAIKPGAPCSAPDDAVRLYLSENGFETDYKLPGVPHRTGHGTGLDIHEEPYLVRGNDTLFEKGMCCSNEPAIYIPGEFGVRHEDHFYVTEHSAEWFTTPAKSIEDPFDVN